MRSRLMKLVAVAAPLAFAAILAGCGDDTVSCPTGQQMCNNQCVNLDSNPSNCGACGTTCKTGETCSAGKCACGGTTTSCNGACVDFSKDPANCGSCGNACPAGSSCNAGKCGGCDAPKLVCDGACIDPQSDNANCGTCGTKCDAAKGFNCVAGKCACIGGMTDCSGTCVFTASDPNNCGACGTKCPAGTACNGGKCEGCNAPKLNCSGQCIDPQSDNNNCGACGTKCDTAAGFNCVAGKCSCVGGLTDCSGKCVDTNNNASNCGTCGKACATGESCIAGVCKTGCPTGQTDCNGQCVTLGSDNNNCGACGVKCTGGKTCNAGKCECPAGQTDCNGTCKNTNTDPTACGNCTTVCATGQVCTGTPPACKTQCPTGQTACNNLCVDTQSSNTNCGQCGVTCTGGKTCVTGACTCPAATPTDCSGTCVNTQTNEKNCGTCGKACAANETCSAGACTPSPVVTVTVTCAQTTVPSAGTTQCTATGTLGSGATVPLTDDPKLTWSRSNDPTNPVTCTAQAGTIDYDPGTGPVKGLWKAGTQVGCKDNVKATYNGTAVVASNTVVITIAAAKITSVTIIPNAPTVPYLKGTVASACGGGSGSLVTRFKLQVNYDNGTTQIAANPTWFSTNTNVATIATDGKATLGNTVPTANQTTTIQASWVDSGTSYNASTVMTVVPGTGTALTSIAVAPATATIPLQGKAGFKVTATFGAATFDVTDIDDTNSNFEGWPRATFTRANGGTYLSDNGINSGTHLHEFTGVLKTTTPEVITAHFCNVAGEKTATASVTVTDGVLDHCTIESVAYGTSCGAAGNPCPWPKGAQNQLYKACGYYTDAPSTCVDITDKVAWSSTNTGIATIGFTAGDANAKANMLAVGQTIFQADPSSIRAGVAKCSSYVNVVNGRTCAVTIVPEYRGVSGRREYRASPTVPGGNLPLFGTDPRPRLPNEANWSQKFNAFAQISTTATCACPTNCVTIQITGSATWGVEPGNPLKPALQYAGTAGNFNTIADLTAPNRQDQVTAKFPEVEGSTTLITGKMQVGVCGQRVTNSVDVVSGFSGSAYTGTAVTTYAGDKSNRYFLSQQFLPASGDCNLPAYTPPFPAGTTYAAQTAGSFLLDISEAAQWTSTVPAAGTVSDAANTKGNLTAVASGTTKIRGSFGGVTDELDFIVDPARVASCTITPTSGTLSYYNNAGIVVASSQQFTANATMTDNSPKPITDTVAWTSTVTGCANFVSATQPGLLTAQAGADCTTTVRARCVGCGATGGDIDCTPVPPNAPIVTSKTATVTNYFIQANGKTCFEAGPTTLSLSVGTQNNLYGCVIFDNGAAETIDFIAGDDGANNATWFSNALGTATVGTDGNVTAVAAGTATVSSTFAGKSANITITVVSSPITSVVLEGVNKNAPNCATQNGGGVTYEFCELEGTNVQYRTIGTRADGTTQDLTTMAQLSCFQDAAMTVPCVVGNGDWELDSNVPGLVQWWYNSGAYQNFRRELRTSVTVGSVTTTSAANAATVLLVSDDNAQHNPTQLLVTVTPSTITGANHYAKTKVVGIIGLLSNITIDVTNNVDFSLDKVSVASVYKTRTNPRFTNGWIVSGAVSASTPVTITAIGGNDWVSNTVTGFTTFNVAP
ncbi:MAG: MXAN_6577-like cysteine-rich protein [Acidobacteriota bacterium]